MRSCQWKSFVSKASLLLADAMESQSQPACASQRSTQDPLEVHRHAQLAEHLWPVAKVLVAALNHIAQLESVVGDGRPAAKIEAEREELALRVAGEGRSIQFVGRDATRWETARTRERPWTLTDMKPNVLLKSALRSYLVESRSL